MTDFASWLRAQANPDPDTAALRAFADPRADWPWWTNSLSDYIGVIQAANPPNKDNLVSAVSVNYGRWQTGQSRPGGLLVTLASHLGTLLLALFGLVVAVAIFYGLFFNPKFFLLMAQVNQARGLITFLFAFATIAIILLVAITTFWMPKGRGAGSVRKSQGPFDNPDRSHGHDSWVLFRDGQFQPASRDAQHILPFPAGRSARGRRLFPLN